MNYILLALLCSSALFGADPTSVVYGSDMPLSHSLSMQPMILDHSASHNWSANFSLGSTLVPEHSHTYAVKPELFMESSKLFFSGEKQQLLELHKSYASWKSSFSFSARMNKMVAKHIESLLQNKHLPQFVALKQAQQMEVPQLLEEILASTNDPMVRAEAMILADDVGGGIICDYNSLLIDLINDNATDMMVTTRFGSHAIDKLFPEHGASLNLREAHDFGQSLIPALESFPECVRESMIRYAVQGFIERSMNPGTSMSQYSSVISELTTGIYDELLGYYLKGPEYEQLRKQELERFNVELDKKLINYSSKDKAWVAGAVISDSCAMRTIVHIGAYAYKHLVAPIVCPQTRMTVEKLLSECKVNNITPPQGKHAGVRDLRCPKSYEQFINDLKEMSVTPLKEYVKKDGLTTMGKDISGKTLIVRPFCSNPKVPKDTPTFEIQPINKLIEKTIKIRSEI